MRNILGTLALAGLVSACGTNAVSPKVDQAESTVKAGTAAVKKVDPTSLYARLGGKEAITKVVSDFVGNVGGDKRINAAFKNVDLDRLKGLLVEQICEATGGPCTYTGRSMKETHAGMTITEADFNALVEDLQKALTANKVQKREQDELLKALGGMKGDIVTAKSTKK